MKKSIVFFFHNIFVVLFFVSCSNFQIDLNYFFQNGISEGKKEILQSITENQEKQTDITTTDFDFIFSTAQNSRLNSKELENQIFTQTDSISLSEIYLINADNSIKFNTDQTTISLYKEDLLLISSQSNQINLKNYIITTGEKYLLVVNFIFQELNLEAKFIIKT